MRKTLCTLAICFALPASAGTYGPYDKIFLFGDSLSDSGNLQDLTGPGFPKFLYPEGDFTNGESWASQIGLTESRKGGTNYAYGSARTNDNMDGIPDLVEQIGAFAADFPVAPANSLGVIWSGGNDFRDLSPTATVPEVKAFIGSIALTISQGVQTLAGKGIFDFVIMGMPDFGTLPQYAGDPGGAAGAAFVSNGLNGALLATSEMLDKSPALTVQYFDTNSLFQDILDATPDAEKRTRCIDKPFDCAANPQNYIFYDDLHPVERIHTALAAEFTNQHLQDVPLPAGGLMLLTGLAGFGVWARRRKSQA